MARLPQPGGDQDTWGLILNDFLEVSLNADGTVKSGVVAKADVGLGNVDNTSDANKPVSTATQTALDGKEPVVAAGLSSQYYRGDKTWQTLDKTAAGLANVDNTSDANKPISTAQQTALDARLVWVDVVDQNTARPAGAVRVIWIGGTIQPVNMDTGDVWLKEV